MKFKGIDLRSKGTPFVATGSAAHDGSDETKLPFSAIPDNSGSGYYELLRRGRAVRLASSTDPAAAIAGIEVSFGRPGNWVTITPGNHEDAPEEFDRIYLRRPSSLPSSSALYVLHVSARGFGPTHVLGLTTTVIASGSARIGTVDQATPYTAGPERANVVASVPHAAPLTGNRLGYVTVRETAGANAVVNVRAGANAGSPLVAAFSLLPNESAREQLPDVDVSAGIFLELVSGRVNFACCTRVIA